MELFLVKHRIFLPIFFGKFDLSISDFSLSVFILPMVLFAFMFFAMRKAQYHPKALQNFVEFVYEKFYAIFKGYLHEEGKRYIPFIFSLMLFIFILNVGNLIPGVFTCTSQLALTLTLGIIVCLLVTIIGLFAHGRKFWNLFIPHGIPGVLKPFLFALELFSYLIRPISLALRLAINMLAGHVMLHVIAGFSKELSTFSIASIAISSILSIFEIGVAALQAYVFAVLSCIYIADILQGHE